MAFDEDSFTPTIFVEDKDVILPSTSSNTIEKLDRHEDLCTSAALAAVFGDGCRLFQPITQGTFVEEVIVEKPPKIVNVTFIPNEQALRTLFSGIFVRPDPGRGLL
jgi:hypothetical protein